MIVVTGASGFIASCLVAELNTRGREDIILVDEFMRVDKRKNIEDKRYNLKVERKLFLDYFRENPENIDLVYHLGARTDTAEMDQSIFDQLNINYSKAIWKICTEKNIPLIYASSAATYGDGDMGFNDSHANVDGLRPLNPYGWSKQKFDQFVLSQKKSPPYWAGIKFFNVFGPNEFHKSRMASVVMHSYKQISQTGGMRLFRSHKEGIENGHQSRDFIYIKDVVDVLVYLGEKQTGASSLFNLGTGTARTFLDLTKAVFKAMEVEESISFIDTPADIRDKYQYFTMANMSKLRSIGYSKDFTSLEDGVTDYVANYLVGNKYY